MFPKIISLDGFFLPTYGFLIAVGFVLALWVTGNLARRSNLDPERVKNLGIYSAIVGLVGAKLLMFLVDFEYYRDNPGELFSLSTLQAAGVFYGGLIAALVFAFYYMRAHKLPVAITLDAFAPGLALGQAFGRLGCFAAGCCWGEVCQRPWAVTFTNTDAKDLTGVPLHVPLHPTQLYESGMAFLIFGLCWRAFHRPHRPGFVIGLYLLTAATARFAVEFFRYHHQPNPFGGPLSTAQWFSLAFAALSLLFFIRKPATQSA